MIAALSLTVAWFAFKRYSGTVKAAPANDEASFGMSQKFEQLKFVFGTHESLARHSALRRSPTREVSGGTQRDTDLRRHQES